MYIMITEITVMCHQIKKNTCLPVVMSTLGKTCQRFVVFAVDLFHEDCVKEHLHGGPDLTETTTNVC